MTQEPPRPQRGRTADEVGSDASEPEQKLAEQTTWSRRLIAAASPRLVLSQADGYPPGVKQFLQFCLILVYPAWLFVVLISGPVLLVFKFLEWLLYVSFWPVRKMLGTAGGPKDPDPAPGP